MAWQTPKTNWVSTDGITTNDLNRIEENTRVLSTSTNTYVQATALGNGTNIYTVTFPNTPTVALGFSFKVRFLASNSVRKALVYLRINGTDYPVKLNFSDPNPYGMPVNYLNTSLIYEVTYDNNQFILRDAFNSYDPITAGRTFFVGSALSQDHTSIQEAINSLRKVSAGPRTILIINRNGPSVQDIYSEDITIENFHGGPITIRAENNVTIEGNVVIQNNTAEVLFQGSAGSSPFRIQGNASKPQAFTNCFNNFKVGFNQVNFLGYNASTTNYCAYVTKCNFVYFYMCEMSGAYTLISADDSRVSVENVAFNFATRRYALTRSLLTQSGTSGNATTVAASYSWYNTN
ncbi:hypothetical protein D3C75_136050 [compost metagenome]